MTSTIKQERSPEKTDLLILDRSNEATLLLAGLVKQKSGKIAYDLSFTSFGKHNKTLESILRLSDLVKVNHKTFVKLSGSSEDSAVLKWRELYPDTRYLLVTNGDSGSYGYANLRGKTQIFHSPAIKCDSIRDCAGSGDIFFGIAASKLLIEQGFDETFESFMQ